MRSSRMLPFVILGGALLVVALLFMARRTPEDRVMPSAAPLVRVTVAEPVPYRFSVVAHGAVSPSTESELVPQVSGEVLWVSPALAAGGFFEAGEPLARIDAADYRVDRETARAAVARAKSGFSRADKEMKRQQRLAAQSVASESRIDDARNELQIAEASLREAQARLERANRDLARTEIKAPYRGRVRAEQVDVGQFVSRGTSIATIYAVDYAEVRLPLPDRELAFLDVSLFAQAAHADAAEGEMGARVALTAEFAGQSHRWEGRLVRTEAELDPRSRMVNVVVRVPDPYGLEIERSTPLAVGLFVEAEIEGQSIDQAFVLPRDALREGGVVYVVEEDGTIRFREVEVLRTERDRVIVGAGLKAGELVCTSPLQAAIDGMQARVLDPVPATPGTIDAGEVAGKVPTGEAVQ